MDVLMVRAKVKAENVADVEAAAEKMFSALGQAKPEGIHYASGKLDDGVTFVALLALDDGVDNPLPSLPAFVEFQEALMPWMAEPPTLDNLTVVGSYNLF